MIEKNNIGKISIEYLHSRNNIKETILFVHGLGANLSQFENQHKYFKKDYNVLSLSLRGHGNTTSVSNLTQKDYSLYEMSQDIIKLLNKLEIEKVHFVGNSMGGNIGYELLESNSKRFLSFTTFGTTAELCKSDFNVSIIKLAYKLLSIKTIAKLSMLAGVTEYSKNKIFEMFSQSSKSTLFFIIPYLSEFNYIKTIKKSKVPTLIIKGRKDKEINKVLDSTIFAFNERKNFTLVEIENSGHFANLDTPKEFNQILYDFVTSIT